MSEDKVSILDLPAKHEGIHQNNTRGYKSRMAAAVRAMGPKITEQVKKATERATERLDYKVETLVNEAIRGTVSDETGLNWDDYKKSWKFDTTFQYKGQKLRDIINQHKDKVINQLRKAVEGFRLNDDELERAKKIYFEEFNKALPEALRRAAEGAAWDLAVKLAKEQLEAELRDELGA